MHLVSPKCFWNIHKPLQHLLPAGKYQILSFFLSSFTKWVRGRLLSTMVPRYRKKSRRKDGERDEGRDGCVIHMLISNRCTGWPFKLCLTPCWHHNISSVLVWGSCTTTLLLFWCQWVIWHNLNGHPVKINRNKQERGRRQGRPAVSISSPPTYKKYSVYICGPTTSHWIHKALKNSGNNWQIYWIYQFNSS